MSATEWMALLVLGGLVGALGQGLRAVGGWKKVYDQADQENKPFSKLFEPSTFLISLLIGFIAGALAILALSGGQTDLAASSLDRKTLFSLFAAGYAGTDFIEAFIKKYPPEQTPPK